MSNFALIGVGGYIAPRHLRAIKDTGHILVAALDINDSVGILDQYFPNASFFTEFERFDRHVEKLRRSGKDEKVDYVSICSPNYLHDAHIRFALRIGANAICEKPLVLSPWNLDALQELEKESGFRVNTILQLRVHPSLIALREILSLQNNHVKHDVVLTYITSRGPWYMSSWKGSVERSGGVATNIGIHFFDLLIWLFGPVESIEVHYTEFRKIGGRLELERASVKWFLSIDSQDLLEMSVPTDLPTFRSITVDGDDVEFSEGFTDLHTVVYKQTLEGNGFGLEDARPAINLAYKIRNMVAEGINKDSHPSLLKLKENMDV